VNIVAQGRLVAPEEFEGIIVKTGEDGRVVRLGDVARVELGAQDYVVNSYLDGKPAVAMVVQQRPGSNALATAERVRERMRELSADFPKGIEYRVVYDPTVFIDESLRAVINTIFEAALLVVVGVKVFLQSWWALIIPILPFPCPWWDFADGRPGVFAEQSFAIRTCSRHRYCGGRRHRSGRER
jgi:multidrug efflux pump subunit AcrB